MQDASLTFKKYISTFFLPLNLLKTSNQVHKNYGDDEAGWSKIMILDEEGYTQELQCMLENNIWSRNVREGGGIKGFSFLVLENEREFSWICNDEFE